MSLPHEESAVSGMHAARDVAESFGTDAARYDRARPRYPADVVAAVVAAAPGPKLLDVGTGTGIVARQLAAAGATVLGVEPDPRMAALAAARGTRVEVSTFEAWDPRGQRFDGVVSGTAWHWVDPVAGARKVADVLRAGGLFAALWNVAEVPHDLASAFGAVYARVAPDALSARAYRREGSLVDAYGAIVETSARGLGVTGAFGEPRRLRRDWERTCTRDAWLEVVATEGGFAAMPESQARDVLDGLGRAVDDHGGVLTVRYATLGLLAVRS